MNFFKALLNVNTLRKDNANLQTTNVELAMRNLDLVSQTETMRDKFLSMDSAMRTLTAQLNEARAEITRLSAPKPAEVKAAIAATNPIASKSEATPSMAPAKSNNHKRRGRKPNKPNTTTTA